MNNVIVDRINLLKHYTKSNIQEMSNAHIPYKSDIKLIEEYRYKLDGKVYGCPVNSKIFMSMELPYTCIPNSTNDTYTMNFKDAVVGKDIYPILIFINGKFIKWSDITLIKDSFYSYLIIKGIEGISNYSLYTITIPEIRITYNEDVSKDNIGSNCVFFFDKNTDLYTSSPTDKGIYTTISIDSDSDISNYKNTVYSNNRFYIPLQYKVEEQSLFVFRNGLFYDPNDIEEFPLNVFNIVSDKNEQFRIVSFTYNNGNTIKDNETNIVNKSVARTRLLSKQNSEFFKQISERMDFGFSSKKDLETNFINALKYIMNYNSNLMNEVYKDISFIKPISFTGAEMVNAINSTDGFVHLSRKLYNNYNCYMMVFKNGYLYDRYKMCRYKNNEFLLSIDSTITNKDDVFELIYFFDIDNRIMETRLWSGNDNNVTLDPYFDLNNLIITTPTPRTKEFQIDTNDNVLYPIDFTARRIDTGTAEIILKDSFYYDKLLYFGSKKQFRYYCKYNTESTSITEFILPDEFKMCNKKESYMMFINGIYIDQTLYSVTIFDVEDPFYRLSVYIDKEILSGDRIEMFYIGNILNKVYENKEKINTLGNIILDSNKLKYPFDKDLYMIFMNGRKSIPSEISNIDSNQFSIKTTSDNIINNVSVIQFVEEDELLHSLFNNTDLLTNIINGLSDSDLSTLFLSGNISTTTPTNSIDLDNRMLRIVKDYYSEPYINTGDDIPINFNNYYKDGQIIDTGNLPDD